MTKLTINGKEFSIKFNLATELSYEELTGNIFDPQDILPQGEHPRSKDVINLALACLIANDAPVTTDYILKEATQAETSELIKAVFTEMLAWLSVPKIAEQHVPEPSSDSAPGAEDSEDNSPNA